MKFHLAIATFLGVLPLFTQAWARPEAARSVGIKRSDAVAGRTVTVDLANLKRHENSALTKRQDDDEWLVVIYDSGDGGQCGGNSNAVVGKKEGSCSSVLGSLTGVTCASASVGVNIGVAKCDFSFRAVDCNGSEEKHITLYAGEDSNGVSLTDQVKFVSVTCSE